ncbi:hypothetical protein EDB83DRAFT_2443704 [Lactarius deliciosus]|nr:hypothetical protein EDB83DRAFT_2443704 [Lactarius deliciosus]
MSLVLHMLRASILYPFSLCRTCGVWAVVSNILAETAGSLFTRLCDYLPTNILLINSRYSIGNQAISTQFSLIYLLAIGTVQYVENKRPSKK